MLKTTTKILFCISLIGLFPGISMAVSFPDFPMAFWGTATIDGQALSSGTKIKAFCGSDLIGEVTMLENGIYGYADSTKIKLLSGNCSGDILFKYLLSGATNPLTGGSEIKYTDGFEEGKTVNKNLEFINTRSCSIANGTGKQTWSGSAWGDCTVLGCNSSYHQSSNVCVVDFTGGGGSSGGGGGGGGATTTPVPQVAGVSVIKGDANNDNKIDKYDFSLMMSSWGKTGTSICDFNNDNKVDKYDFALLMLNWSK
ncbi:MAG: dockerin type I domain-containing protein [Patescibacteria group bacterium]